MRSDHEVVQYYKEVRWFSRGRVLKRLFELRVEVLMFLKDQESALYQILEIENFLQGLAYLADIFSYFNEINLSLQGPAVTIVDATEKLKAFLGKLPLWKRRVDVGVTANFCMLEELLSQSEMQSSRSLNEEIQKGISDLKLYRIRLKGTFALKALIRRLGCVAHL
ncbi:protein FAM200C-like [Hydra vulgaris]|uniref:Protein FAM200C-like n=1 Tax=Hydra vulgaris TaxID=6087 RepID=A0ABM4BN40_HYDVU